jgi:hypothetical protein
MAVDRPSTVTSRRVHVARHPGWRSAAPASTFPGWHSNGETVYEADGQERARLQT